MSSNISILRIERGGIMKIQGPNPYIKTYRNQQPKHVLKKSSQQQDEINISTQAKKLQKNHTSIERAQYVSEIKERVQSGQYKIDYDLTAQKMIDFWAKRV